MPDDDDEADKYELADAVLTGAGLQWYEVSNWSTSTATRCRHNVGYWGGGDWWGIGPGAHSHVGGVRWWNVKHPSAYAARIAAGHSPAHAREVLTVEQQHAERVLLGVRLREGLDTAVLTRAGRARSSASWPTGWSRRCCVVRSRRADPAGPPAGRRGRAGPALTCGSAHQRRRQRVLVVLPSVGGHSGEDLQHDRGDGDDDRADREGDQADAERQDGRAAPRPRSPAP